MDKDFSELIEYFQEMLMLAQKVDRHEKWLQQIADKIGIKLEY